MKIVILVLALICFDLAVAIKFELIVNNGEVTKECDVDENGSEMLYFDKHDISYLIYPSKVDKSSSDLFSGIKDDNKLNQYTIKIKATALSSNSHRYSPSSSHLYNRYLDGFAITTTGTQFPISETFKMEWHDDEKKFTIDCEIDPEKDNSISLHLTTSQDWPEEKEIKLNLENGVSKKPFSFTENHVDYEVSVVKVSKNKSTIHVEATALNSGFNKGETLRGYPIVWRGFAITKKGGRVQLPEKSFTMEYAGHKANFDIPCNIDPEDKLITLELLISRKKIN